MLDIHVTMKEAVFDSRMKIIVFYKDNESVNQSFSKSEEDAEKLYDKKNKRALMLRIASAFH